MSERRGRPPKETLSADEGRLVEQIEGLYGPPRWGWGGVPRPAARLASRLRGQPRLRGPFLRTVLVVAAAFLAWYAVVGGEFSLQRALSILISPRGVAATPPSIPAEYELAAKTLNTSDLAMGDPLVLEFKALLDSLGAKCKEDRFRLAALTITATDSLARRGRHDSYLVILTAVDSGLPEQTRGSWPTSCADAITRFVAARTR